MPDSAPGLLDRHHFALRRLHSLTGIIPVGVFLINHLLANSTAFLGSGHFNHHIELIHSLPWLLAIEIVFIFIPLAFHGAYGVLIAWQGKLNQNQYPYMDNWRYTLQRVTAWITIVFLLVHLAHFRFAHWFGVMEYKAAHDDPGFFFFTKAGFHGLWLPLWLWMVVYAIGLTAAVYHFCNGIVTFCITWGITTGVAARKKMSVVAGGLALVLMAWGLLSLVALARPPKDTERKTLVVSGTHAVQTAERPSVAARPSPGTGIPRHETPDERASLPASRGSAVPARRDRPPES
ncbi:MAG: succinate dehydrogenase [Planctomycetota bacterium]